MPQISNDLFIADGGIETTLIFREGFDLPSFAAFVLLRHKDGAEALRRYFGTYAGLARRYEVGVVLETATWRANRDWGKRLGYSRAALAEANRQAVDLLFDIRAAFETPKSKIVISGCVGPRGDGYDASRRMSVQEAERYHAEQIEIFEKSGVDLTAALTMTYQEEAIGIVRAARAAGLPAVISFTVETDGRLPTGQKLGDAIQGVDDATSGAAAYFMVNCAHPTHFEGALSCGEPWVSRIRGIRVNASMRSHAQLDRSPDLDDGNPVELGQQCGVLRSRLPNVNVLGGCCGTDHRHVEEMCKASLAFVD